VRLVVAFVVGAVLGGLIAALALRPTHTHGDRPGGVWRERAEVAERDLAAARRQLDNLTNELRALSTRFDDLTARFEAMQTGNTAEATAAPPQTTTGD
jgi:hypothetical protein